LFATWREGEGGGRAESEEIIYAGARSDSPRDLIIGHALDKDLLHLHNQESKALSMQSCVAYNNELAPRDNDLSQQR